MLKRRKNGKFQRFVQNENDVRLSSSVAEMCYDGQTDIASLQLFSKVTIHTLKTFFEFDITKWCDNSIFNATKKLVFYAFIL